MTKFQWNGEKIKAATSRAMRKAVDKTAADTVRNAKVLAPIGVTGGLRRSIDYTPATEEQGKAHSQIGFTGANLAALRAALAMEFGRRRGKGVPPGALDLWVLRKIRPKASTTVNRQRLRVGAKRKIESSAFSKELSKKDLRSSVTAEVGHRSRTIRNNRQRNLVKGVAFLISRKIKQRGLIGRKFLSRAADRTFPYLQGEIVARFKDEINPLKKT